MKTARLVAGLFVMVALLSCTNHNKKQSLPGKATDTLTYTTSVVEEEADDCKNDSTGCGYARITYQVFKNMPLLNDSVKNRLISELAWIDTLNKMNDLDTVAKRFVSVYNSELKKSKRDENLRPYTLECETSLSQQYPGLVVLNISETYSTNWMHGFYYTYFLNWDTKANKMLYLKDILKKGHENEFLKIAEKQFRSDANLAPGVNPSDSGYDFANDKFALNNNYCFTGEGILFTYNIYEIRGYSGGPVDLLIPYKSIKQLLQPNTVISRYVK